MRISDWSSDVCSSDLIPDPFGFGVEPGHILAGARVFHTMLVVPDAHPDIQLVVEDAGASPHVAADARVAPRLSRRTGDAFGVEVAGAGVWALPHRSEERRVGQECVSTCRSRWSQYH